MMSNITISIDDALLKKAKKIAIDKDTSFSGLVRDYINELVEKEEKHREMKVQELMYLFKNNSAKIGSIKWTRAELHER